MYDFSGLYALELTLAFFSICYLINLTKKHMKKRVLKRKNPKLKIIVPDKDLLQIKLEVLASKILGRPLYDSERSFCLRDITLRNISEDEWKNIIIRHKEDRGYIKEDII